MSTAAGWIVDELAPHLPLELDFVHEAANLERCRAFFAASPAKFKVTFALAKGDGSPDDRLPVAHTCSHEIDLPDYSSAEVLRERLFRAIREMEAGGGFNVR